MERLTKLREYMEKENLDGFYVAKPANVRCISGYTGEDSFLFITKANQYFITDARYTEQASYECPEYETGESGSAEIWGKLLPDTQKKTE